MTDGPTGVPFGKHNALIAAVESLKRQHPTLLGYLPVVAKLKKAQYDSFIAEGFSPEQALNLLKKGIEI